MKRTVLIVVALLLLAVPAFGAEDMAAALNAVIQQGPANGNWQVKAADVAAWIKAGKKDFQVVDVRLNPKDYAAGHIPGAVFIPYHKILEPGNLKKLPKDKRLVLVCVTGQTQNLPVVALRALGYNAWTMSFGHAAWIKGYFGGKIMRGAIAGAAKNNYPVEK